MTFYIYFTILKKYRIKPGIIPCTSQNSSIPWIYGQTLKILGYDINAQSLHVCNNINAFNLYRTFCL